MRENKRQKTHNTDFVQDGLPTKEIREKIEQIRAFVDANKQMKSEDIEEKLRNDYSFFAKRYPMLYAMACNTNAFDYQSLEYFLNMRDNVINNKMTSEDASKQVGQDWFNKYVDVSKLNKTI